MMASFGRAPVSLAVSAVQGVIGAPSSAFLRWAMPAVVVMAAMAMAVRVIRTRPLRPLLRLRRSAAPSATPVPAPLLWRSVSVVGVAVVRPLAVLLPVARLPRPLVVVSWWFVKVWWIAGLRWWVGPSYGRSCVHFRNSLCTGAVAVAVVDAVCKIRVIVILNYDILCDQDPCYLHKSNVIVCEMCLWRFLLSWEVLSYCWLSCYYNYIVIHCVSVTVSECVNYWRDDVLIIQATIRNSISADADDNDTNLVTWTHALNAFKMLLKFMKKGTMSEWSAL